MPTLCPHSVGHVGRMYIDMKTAGGLTIQMKKYSRYLAAGAASALLLSIVPVVRAAGTGTEPSAAVSSVSYDRRSYQDYLMEYADQERPDVEIELEGIAYTSFSGEAPQEMELAGRKALSMSETCDVTWTFDVPSPGLYKLEVSYYPLPGKGIAIERGILINGVLPYTECSAVNFDRIWTDIEEDGKETDANGNDLRPVQVEAPDWQTVMIKGMSATVSQELEFYFEQGQNTLTLQGVREPLAIARLRLYNPPAVQSYQAYIEQYAGQSTNVTPIVIQGEDATRKSSTVLYAQNDRSSPLNVPYHAYQIKLNTIGGENWRFPAQWIEWDFYVPETGMYKLAFRCRNDFNEGTTSHRALYIDGELPFAELGAVPFSYKMDWQSVVPGEEEPYLIYLEEGTHTLRLENVVGPLSGIIRRLDSVVYELNTIYRKIVMITGVIPDGNRDYRLEKVIPEMTSIFEEQSRALHELCDQMLSLYGQKTADYALLQKVAVQLDSFLEDTNTVAKRLDSFRTNISNLAAWTQSVCEQPLLLDSISFLPQDAEAPKANASFFRQLWHNILSFFYSFWGDYNYVAGENGTERKVTVWMGAVSNVGLGRDQAQIIKNLTDNSFTPQEGIGVDLRLVDMSILLPAVAAGKGPDVALGQGQNVPVNYALRGAVRDLSDFEGIDEVLERFTASAVTPFRFGEGVFALPEKLSFSMMFYRKDVLAELGIEVPQTWTELYEVIPQLQKNNLDIGLPNISDQDNLDLFYMKLYQTGGQVYNDDLTATALGTDTAIAAFTSWTDLYTKYKAPKKVDFLTRFRTGETPLFIGDLSYFNQISALAPEIRGLWDFSLVPGTPTAEGGVNHQTATTVTGCIILKNAQDPEAAWRFIEWWTRAQTQSDYARELENLQGTSGRWMTANQEAFESLAWTTDELEKITRQRDFSVGIPEAPGSYMVTRYIATSVRLVINNNAPVRDTLLNWNEKINKEITLKRKEFDLE